MQVSRTEPQPFALAFTLFTYASTLADHRAQSLKRYSTELGCLASASWLVSDS